MLLSDIDTWNVGALQSIAHELGGELTTIEDVASDLELISRLPGWDSPAADAARGKIAESTAKVLDDAAVIGAVRQLASETAAAVAKLHNELESIRADVAAQGGYLSLSDAGDVTINASPDMRDELRPIADNVESRAKALIHQAEDIDADCAEVFGHVENGDITAKGATDIPSAQEMGRDQSGLSAPYPPEGEGTRPEDVKAWWDALSEDEQGKVKAEHPDWVGNRDGVPVPDRSDVNKASLDRELADVRRQLDELGGREDFIRNSGMDAQTASSVYLERYGALKTRLDNADAMRNALSVDGDPSKGYDPDRYLMLLEFPEGRETRAAVAIGNPDAAEHVSVTVPGMNTHPTSLPGMADEAGALRATAERQLDLAGRGNEGVAAIAWLGYDPPDTTDGSAVEALGERRANEAAPGLAELYRGINATNEHGSDVHLSAFGHSYGSLATAQALNELGATGVVDEAVFYGSPGLGHTDETVGWGPLERAVPIMNEGDLNMADKHVYVMSSPDDPVSGDPTLFGVSMPGLGDLNQLGPNPLDLPFERLSTDAAITGIDQVPRDASYGHADYPRSTDNGLRTAGYNLAIVAAGLADDPEYPNLLVR
ncbi:MAG: alpha/beta hydrolase family protein [Mycobacteriaceae bacterium]|nr:alpha/beta hydrolase family protein [Mycobacteriaceae bacterium]